ncbi:hypothetical protein BLA24064_04326 [Burkholderia latens]|uniref:Integrase n=1 Tax=Burkholderia latens TaxID=488446 RepID=A0A6P2MYI3_9BURK|nr:hypothetical protein [Burkholderia latens]VWB91039.1 hypothetical protein BLA24064_04326 [Burkholderia latens]
MATITLRGTKWQVKIRRKGQPSLSATFVSEEAAERWAEEHEHGDTIKPVETGPTVGDLFRKYIAHPMPDKRSSEWGRRTLQRLLKREIAPNPRGSNLHAAARRTWGRHVHRRMDFVKIGQQHFAKLPIFLDRIGSVCTACQRTHRCEATAEDDVSRLRRVDRQPSFEILDGGANCWRIHSQLPSRFRPAQRLKKQRYERIDVFDRPMCKRRETEAVEILAAASANVGWQPSSVPMRISLFVDRRSFTARARRNRVCVGRQQSHRLTMISAATAPATIRYVYSSDKTSTSSSTTEFKR